MNCVIVEEEQMQHSGTAPDIIDYSCEDGRFLVSASCVKISKPDWLSSSETGVTSGIRS
jgi:hypothetical protein